MNMSKDKHTMPETRSDIKAVLRHVRRQISQIDESTEDAAVKARLTSLRKDEKDLIDELIALDLDEDDTPTAARATTESAKSMQQHMLLSYLKDLNFNASNEESLGNFLVKLEAIAKSVPLLSFAEIYLAIRPSLPAAVIKSLNSKKIDDIDTLKKHLLALYGSFSSVYQRLEAWMGKPKNNSSNWTRHTTVLQSSLESLKVSYAAMLRRRDESRRSREEIESKPFEPTYEDAFELLLYLKLLQDISSVDTAVHRTVSVELDSLHTPMSLATRAESVKCQTTLSAAAFRGKPRKPAEQDDAKSDKPAKKGTKKKKDNKNAAKKETDQKKGQKGKPRSGNGQENNAQCNQAAAVFALRDQSDYDSVEEKN